MNFCEYGIMRQRVRLIALNIAEFGFTFAGSKNVLHHFLLGRIAALAIRVLLLQTE